MLVSNQNHSSAYSKNSNVQNKNNNNIQFKGTIDKSVTNYLKDVRKDIIKTQRKKTNFDINIVKETKDAIGNIMTRLKAFMSQTADETTLVLKKTRTTETGAVLGRLKFVDTKTGAEIPAEITTHPKMHLHQGITIEHPPEKEYTIKPYNDNLLLSLLGMRGKHKTIDDLKLMEKWSKNLREHVEPVLVDINLRDQARINKVAKQLKHQRELQDVSNTKRKEIEMKQAIKELKDIKIEN